MIYTLVADGSSDRVLARVINFILDGIPALSEQGYTPQVADVRGLTRPGKGLGEKLRLAIREFPCDILFVHRDAEGEPPEKRVEEIREAAAEAGVRRWVPLVPVRMTEAWLLLEEKALRRAADNPNGTVPLLLPRVGTLEAQPDPKAMLFDRLLAASEKTGRRREQFKADRFHRRARVADFIQDFSPLDQLPAFVSFKYETERVVHLWLAGG